MSRSEKKRFHKQFETLLRTKGENCSGCGRAFRRNERAHGGFTRSDRVALVGECCKSMLMVEYVAGVFSSQSDPLLDAAIATLSAGGAPLSDDQMERALSAIQSHGDRVDDFADQVMRQAGIAGAKGQTDVSFAPTTWSEADAEWFGSHSDRSHRMRPMFPGEFPHLERPSQPPAGHEFQTLVRQVEVGQRIRMRFCRPTGTPIPDLEPILHALFDKVSERQGTTGVLTVAEVAELARNYATVTGRN